MSQNIMAMTLPADLEINAYVGEGKEKKDAFILNSVAYFLVQKSVSMSHHT